MSSSLEKGRNPEGYSPRLEAMAMAAAAAMAGKKGAPVVGLLGSRMSLIMNLLLVVLLVVASMSGGGRRPNRDKSSVLTTTEVVAVVGDHDKELSHLFCSYGLFFRWRPPVAEADSGKEANLSSTTASSLP